MKKKEMKRKIEKIEEYIDLLDTSAKMARETAENFYPDKPEMQAHFHGMAFAYELAASGFRIRLMQEREA